MLKKSKIDRFDRPVKRIRNVKCAADKIESHSSQIIVLVGHLFVAGQVVAVDKTLDAFLDVGRLDGKLELLHALRDELVVRERLAHLHYAHDGRVHLILAVLEHLFVRRLVLFLLLVGHSLEAREI